MACRIKEIMNHELFAVRPGARAAELRATLVSLGLGAAPVIDGDGRPVGMIALRDVVDAPAGASVADRMSRPAVSIDAEESIQVAARLLADTGFHHLPVVDRDGRAVGFVSALDVVRGLIGEPAPHPSVFPHLEPQTGVTWTDEHPLSFDHIEAAPAGPGVLVLVHGGSGHPDRVVWAEQAEDVRARLAELLSPECRPRLRRWFKPGTLRFRAALVPDPEQRSRALAHVRESDGGAPKKN